MMICLSLVKFALGGKKIVFEKFENMGVLVLFCYINT